MITVHVIHLSLAALSKSTGYKPLIMFPEIMNSQYSLLFAEGSTIFFKAHKEIIRFSSVMVYLSVLDQNRSSMFLCTIISTCHLTQKYSDSRLEN